MQIKVFISSLVFLLFYGSIHAQLLRPRLVQERMLEVEYRLNGNLASLVEQHNNFNGEQIWSEGELSQFSQAISLDFRARKKFWFGVGFQRINFSQSAVNSYQQLSVINTEGVVRAYETRLWYKLRARQNHGIGAYAAFALAPISMSLDEALYEQNELINRLSTYNANLFLTRFGAKGYWFLKPITNLGLQAEAYISPIFVDNKHYSGNTPSFKTIGINGFGGGYRLGVNYKFTRLYVGLDVGQDVFNLGKSNRNINHLNFSSTNATAKVGLFLLRRNLR